MARIPRLAMYGLLSTLGASAVVGSAIRTKPNFYTAAVTIGQSSGALMVLANFLLFNVICFGVGVKALFFGRLRRVEYEHLFERLWIFLTESLLAMTIFRDDFSVPFAIMFGLLVFVKCFHWITADRVDYMDQIPHPGPPTIFHIRITTILLLLTLIDTCLILYSLESLLYDGVSATILFASEFTILLATVLGTAARYGVGVVDIRRARGDADAPAWAGKGMVLFYIDLGVDFVKLLTYLTFFLAILLSYGLPLHILRDVYMTLRSFISRCQDLVRYRRATKDMDNLYPDATHAEVEAGDGVCIICREEMVAANAPVPAATQQEGADGHAPEGAVGEGGAAPGQAGSADGRQVPSVATEQQQQQQQQQQQRQRQRAQQAGPNETPKKLQCGHIFHFHCLRSWLERQQSCPTCRRDVLQPQTQGRPRARGQGQGRNDGPFPLGAFAPGPVPAPGPAPPQPGAAPTPAQAPAPTPAPAPAAAAQSTDTSRSTAHTTAQVPTASDPAQPSTGPVAPVPIDLARPHAPYHDDAARRVREEFERYFRFPCSGAEPTRAMGAEADAGPSRLPAGGSSVPQSKAQGHGQAVEEVQALQAVQRGIWGGPIEVGRFFVPPLGAAPRFTIGRGGIYGPGIGYEGESRARSDRGTDGDGNGTSPWAGLLARGNGIPSIHIPPAYDLDADEAGPSNASGRHLQHVNPHNTATTNDTAGPASGTGTGTGTISGLRTPAYSNPPTVFRSLSESGPRPAIAAPVQTDSNTAVANDGKDKNEAGDEEDDEDVEVVQMSEEERRRAVAEATARRLGLRSATIRSASPSEPGNAAAQASVPSVSGPILDKGKGKAKAEPVPYLSLPTYLSPLDSDELGQENDQDGVPADEDAEVEMARLLSVALDQGRPVHVRSGTFGPDEAQGDTTEVQELKEELAALRAEMDSLRKLGQEVIGDEQTLDISAGLEKTESSRREQAGEREEGGQGE